MDMYYTVSDKPKAAEIKIKGSRFITHIFHVKNKEQVQWIYRNLCNEYRDAKHNCYAYRILENEYKYSDDGEPAGTAGKPILQVIQNKNLYQVLIIITRYFGGIKLGTGGLSRAYSEASKMGLNNVSIIAEMQYTETQMQVRYDQLKSLMFLINKYNGKTDQINYKERISLKVKIPKGRFPHFQQEINQIIK